jgi:opacity protein-like surface antigen
MKKLLVVFSIVTLLTLLAAPALADWSLTADYVWGEKETEFWDGATKAQEDSDFTGGLLGLGFTHHNFFVNYDFIYCDLDTAIAGDDVNRLNDLRFGWRFYEDPHLEAAVLLSYIHDECGDFKAKGPTLGLGVKYRLPGNWSITGRFGYSPTGVKVENSSYLPYDDEELFTWALALNYQLTDRCSCHTGYRYYGFSGETSGVDLKSEVKLYTVGLTCKFSCGGME